MYLDTKELSDTPARIGQWRELAEAIRMGCKLRPVQCFGTALDGDDAACALGAASSVWPRYTPMSAPTGGCPICHSKCGNTIAHLNDDHRWTREAIADWLDTL